MNFLRLPDPLLPGDTIALLSPSGAVDEVFIAGAEKQLSQWGYSPRRLPHADARRGRFAGTVAERLGDLRDALSDPSVRALFCNRGGYGAVQLLEDLNPEWIRKNPKWIVGYSDITALHAAWNRAGVVSVHAPMARHLTETKADDPAAAALRALLAGEAFSYTTAPHPLNRSGQADGVFYGGNLSVLYGLRGTPFDFDPTGKILFLEDIGERAYHLERMLYNLRLGGVLERIAGLVVGCFAGCGEDPLLGRTVYEIIADLTADYAYPRLFDFPVGHSPENLPLPEGGCGSLTVDDSGGRLCFRPERHRTPNA